MANEQEFISKSIKVSSVAEEYTILDNMFSSWELRCQTFTRCGNEAIDKIELNTPKGVISVYFDVSDFM